MRGHGFGLYLPRLSILNGYELLVGGEHQEPLAARSWEGGRAVFQLTTLDFAGAQDSRLLGGVETVGLKWDSVIDAEHGWIFSASVTRRSTFR